MGLKAWLRLGWLQRTFHERIFAVLSVPFSLEVSAFVHGEEMAELSHFCEFRVPEEDSNH